MKKVLCKLSVNVNKIATLRNSRGGDVPNVLKVAEDIIGFGAQGITVHPRPDERHIRRQDVLDLYRLLKKINRNRQEKIEFNIEGYPNTNYLKLLELVHPDQATLVPDPPHVITSNAGWNLSKNKNFLKKVIGRLRKNKIRSSIFIDVFKFSRADLNALNEIRPDRVELYTEKYAADFLTPKRTETTKKYATTARKIAELGIGINAGHDLSLENINYLVKSIPTLAECSIGHALISESLYLGLNKTIKTYKRKMRR